jgi:hypothetical protein
MPPRKNKKQEKAKYDLFQTFDLPQQGNLNFTFLRCLTNGIDLTQIGASISVLNEEKSIAEFFIPTKDVPSFCDVLKHFALNSVLPSPPEEEIPHNMDTPLPEQAAQEAFPR